MIDAPTRTAADVAGLPKLSTVDVKALAEAAGVSVETVWRRLRLWETEPANPRALPYVRALGRPFRIKKMDALRFLQEFAA